MGDHEPAKELEQAATSHNERGQALADQLQFDKAIEEYSRADALWERARSRDRRFALRNWAQALTAKKLYKDAIEKHRAAVAVKPDDAESHNSLGIALEAQEMFDDAIAEYREAISEAAADFSRAA